MGGGKPPTFNSTTEIRMPDEENEYQKDLEIDEFNLDKEWLEQSNRYMKYAELCADAERDMNEIHEELKVTRSELVTECKEEDPKATGPEIEAYYRTATSHKDLKDQFLTAQHNFRIMETAVRAFYMRKVALENLVRLQLSSFYGDPTSPEGVPGHDRTVKSTAAKTKVKGAMRGRRTK